MKKVKNKIMVKFKWSKAHASLTCTCPYTPDACLLSTYVWGYMYKEKDIQNALFNDLPIGKPSLAIIAANFNKLDERIHS